MSGMLPGGDKLPKVKKEYDLDVTLTAVIGGVAIAKLGGMETLGYVVASVGCLSTIIEVRRLFNPYKALLESCNLNVGNQVPRYIGKRKTPYGYCLTFSLPFGMSTDDFEKKKLAIEQYLNKKIEIAYNNYRVFIKVYEIELEKSPPFQIIETKGICEFPIGIAFGGKIITVDLEKAIHLLIAGETGGGKSTLLRGIITIIILTKPNIHLYLIDLKGGVEFNVFRKCKNVKAYCKNKTEAEEVLNMMINEVDRRFELFNENDVVDIGEYNKLKGKKKLEYKIIVVDEFADLQNEKDSISVVETLAAKARACGIHIIISTQRPDMKILNGRIKANIPCTIGLKTKNGLNSRIIIDEEGLEELRGKGHGLLSDGGLKEFQSFYITNEEARDLIKHTYIEKKPPTKLKEEPIGQVDNLRHLKALVGGKK